MASLEEAVASHLAGFAGLSSLVAARLYPVQLPQAPTLPAVTYFVTSGDTKYRHGGSTGFAETFLQIDAWANTYGAAKAVAEQVRLAMITFTGTIASFAVHHADKVNVTDLLEKDEAGRVTHHIALDYSVRHAEAVA
jgi:hypothetical protein